MPAPTSKTCSACGASKPLDEFHAHPRGLLGRQSRCKECQRAAKRAARPARPASDDPGPPPGTKACQACGVVKALECFNRNAGCRDGRLPTCADCRNAARRRDTPRAARIAEQRELRAAGSKRCFRCGEVKPLDGGFYPNAAARDGYQGICKPCAVEDSVARQRADRAKENARNKAWRDANPEAARANGRRARATRRARLRGAFVEVVDPLVVLERDDGVCGFCGGDVDPLSFDVDHEVPLSEGGEHSYANCRAAHPGCNRARSTIGQARVG